MKPSLRITLSRLILGGVVLSLLLLGTQTAPVAARSDGGLAVVELINRLRAELGLYPYTVNETLMAVAQAQSEYQASINTISHYGPDGSRPRDRLAAAGYAPAGSFFVHENVYCGTMATPYDAFNWWRNSQLHFEGMTSTRYAEIGAGTGVNTATGLVCYTALFAVWAGNAPPATSPPPAGVTVTPGPARVPVEVATPGPDGAIWHEVQTGQTLWDIAIAYDVDLYEMLDLNNISVDNPVIYPGDLILIRPAPTPTPTATDTPQPEATATPTITPPPRQATAVEIAIATPDVISRPAGEQETAHPGPDLRLLLTAVMVILMLAGTGMIAAGVVVKRIR